MNDLHEIADVVSDIYKNSKPVYNEGKVVKKETNPRPDIIVSISNWLNENIDIYTFNDTSEIIYYSDEVGHYVFGGETYISGTAQSILDHAEIQGFATRYIIEEILGQIKRSTYIDREEFKESPDLICVANGVLDTKTGEFIEHSSEYRFLTKFPVKYDPIADCPKIDAFLTEVVGNKKGLFYEIVGSTLRKENVEQKAVVCVGEGSNGKSTAIRVVSALLGNENTTSISLQELEEDRFAVANLYQKHANLVADMESKDLKGTSKFKAATGGDQMRAQNKNGHPFFFVNFAKFIISCNKLPKTSDDMRAFYRRWIIIQFTTNFEGKENRNMMSTLITEPELSGLLNKAIAAYKGVRETGQFSYNATSAEIRKLYVHLSDSATAFCEDMLQSSEDDVGILKESIWFTYLKFCKDQHLIKISETKFWMTIPEIFPIYTYRSGSKQRMIRGIEWVARGSNGSNVEPTAVKAGDEKPLEGGGKANSGVSGASGVENIKEDDFDDDFKED
jgi:P4 family phage/plasmid primase-like protien